MKKDIKDYLHLYPKCWGSVYDSKSQRYIQGEWALSFALLESVMMDECKFKPILRPLSDMTEEEKVHCYSIMFPKHTIVEFSGADLVGRKEAIEYIDRFFIKAHPMTPKEFLLLLSKHFDLFGLIESGLAIDKTSPHPEREDGSKEVK